MYRCGELTTQKFKTVLKANAQHGVNGSLSSFFWFFTCARGLTGIGVGGEVSKCAI